VERYYWLCRKSEEIELARCAASTEARLAHQELADRCGAKAKAAETDALAALGFAKVRADQYLVNGNRYTTAGDDLAEAQRSLAS